MSRPTVEGKFNENGDGVRMNGAYIMVDLASKQSWWKRWLSRHVEYRIMVWVDQNGEERCWIGKRFRI